VKFLVLVASRSSKKEPVAPVRVLSEHPQHRGGGIVHGPVPRDYSQRTPKKMIQKALLSALSDRARADRIHVVKGLGTDKAPSTKVAAKLHRPDCTRCRNVLVVIGRDDMNGQKSVRNLPGIHAVHPDQLNTYDVLEQLTTSFSPQKLWKTFVASKANPVAKDGTSNERSRRQPGTKTPEM
jgi:large subunit ribosomal protein L4